MKCHQCKRDIPDCEPAKVYHENSHWWNFCYASDCYIEWRIRELRKELASFLKLRRKS